MPERIQLKRTKGWRKPEGAIVVSRPSRWGNPWCIVVERSRGRTWYCVRHVTEERRLGSFSVPEHARQTATRQYYSDLVNDRLPYSVDDVERELAGRDVACWCPPAVPCRNGRIDFWRVQCHADVLPEIANATTESEVTA